MTEVKLTSVGGVNRTFNVPDDDACTFYKGIAQEVVTVPYPDTVTLVCDKGSVQYSVNERGGTLCIFEVKGTNTISGLAASEFPHKKLALADWVTAEKQRESRFRQLNNALEGEGSYKFYELEPGDEEGTVKATWGRVSALGGSAEAIRATIYDNVGAAWMKYYEKISKGYHDLTEIYLETEEEIDEPEEDDAVERKVNVYAVALYKILSEQVTSALSYTMENTHITQNMIKASQETLNKLYKMKVETKEDLEAFNTELLNLMLYCPRKVYDMKEWRVNTKADIKKTLEREQDLVDAMQGKLTMQKNESRRQKAAVKANKDALQYGTEPFTAMDITIGPVSDEIRGKILNKLPGELKSKVANIYRVDSKAHRERFEKYLKDNNLTKKDIKTLWHGSRNENWLSIIEKGLMIHPNAKITGKMFGYGIYFAPSALKSWGYTSYTGSYWAKGGQNLAFMGLYQCAYGKPYHPGNSWGEQYDAAFMKRHGCNCLHAQRGDCSLRNDEIVFYSEAAMYLSYIVEFH